ncbi:hypothetical protein [Methanothrix soehngenii]
MTEQMLTVQCKLSPTDSQAEEMEDTLKAFADACNWINQNTPAKGLTLNNIFNFSLF